MTSTQIINSKDLKRRFVKDNNLPITVFDEPYFMERLNTVDCLFNCIEKWNVFCKELEAFENAEDYFAYYNDIKDTVITHIQANPAFIAFGETVIPKADNSYPRANLYSENNWWKRFISIDMRRANYTSLSLYNTHIFDDCNTWEEFMEQFTSMKHILNSKYIRQVIMGACNPKRQIQYETWLMQTLYEFIKNQVPGLELFSLNVDEIILVHPCEYKDAETADRMVRDVQSALNRHVVGMKTRMSEFTLEPLAHYGYVKTDYRTPETFEFKCVDAETFHQHLKLYKDETITENDLVFYHNGELARFLNPIPNYLNPIASS